MCKNIQYGHYTRIHLIFKRLADKNILLKFTASKKVTLVAEKTNATSQPLAISLI